MKKDLSKAKKELAWSPKFSFEEGIEKTIQWYKKKHTRITGVFS